MVDLSASWSYTTIDLGSGINVLPGQLDRYDNTIIGLENNRILEPNTKYKKFFMFKLPNQLLDVTCKHEQYAHCLLPPSFGIDSYKNGGKYSQIKVNSVLGCGHLGVKGSPILTSDLCDEDVSINYTIDARIVGKDKKSQKLNIMKEKEYNLRVIPFGFTSTMTNRNVYSKQLKDLQLLIQERINALEAVFAKLKNNEPITTSDLHSTDLSGTIDSNTDLDSEEILRRKLDQLHINNRLDDNCNLFNNFKSMSPKENTVESELRYKAKVKHKSTPTLNSGFFSGFLGGSGSSSTSVTSGLEERTSSSTTLNTDHSSSKIQNSNHSSSLQAPKYALSESHSSTKSGIIVLTTKIPQKSVLYHSPSLLRKTNRFENKNHHDQENWLRLSKWVPENESEPLTKLDIQLTCIQSNNSLPHNPPQIHSVTTELICINAKSDSSIPIKLHSELLMDTEKMMEVKETFKKFYKLMLEYKKKFKENSEKLNELYNVNRTIATMRELKFTDFISAQMSNDMESMHSLEVEVTNLHDVFVKQPPKPDAEDSGFLKLKPNNNEQNTGTTQWLKKHSSQYERKLACS